jgi:tripartite-type tricarboxylate transporter receptor subunit TctC
VFVFNRTAKKKEIEMRSGKARLMTFAALIFGVGFVLPQPAIGQAPFFEGKTIRFVQARAAGGTGDMRVRAQTQILRKYIPGNPIIVHEFMPGGGGRTAANHIYRTAQPDGLTIGAMTPGFVPSAVLGETGVLYDLDKTIYLGSPDGNAQWIFATRKAFGADSLAKLRALSGVRIGAQAVGHPIYLTGRLFAYLLGLKDPRFVSGYTTQELDIALLRGEVDARANLAETVVHRNPEWIAQNLVDFHSIIEVQKGIRPSQFDKVPELGSFAKSDLERKVLALLRGFRGTGSPNILPPGTPKDRVEILQEALRKTFRDPEFHKEFKKLAGDDAAPLMPEELEKAIKDLPREPEVIGLFKKLSGADPLPVR